MHECEGGENIDFFFNINLEGYKVVQGRVLRMFSFLLFRFLILVSFSSISSGDFAVCERGICRSSRVMCRMFQNYRSRYRSSILMRQIAAFLPLFFKSRNQYKSLTMFH